MNRACIVVAAIAALSAAGAHAYDPMPDPRMAQGAPGSAGGVLPPIGTSSFLDGLPQPTAAKSERGQPRFGTTERRRINGAGGYNSFDRQR